MKEQKHPIDFISAFIGGLAMIITIKDKVIETDELYTDNSTIGVMWF